MNGEDRTKIQNIVRRLRAILDELRELEKTSQDTSVKQMAISAALALAWVDLVENFRVTSTRRRYVIPFIVQPSCMSR